MFLDNHIYVLGLQISKAKNKDNLFAAGETVPKLQFLYIQVLYDNIIDSK